MLKPSRVPSYRGKGFWPNRHITFIVAKKLNLQFILLYLRYWEGVGWKHHMGEVLAENVRKPSYRGEGV